MASNINLKKFYEFGRKIVCVGRNYREHALELNNPIPGKPIIFAKTTNAFVLNGGKIKAPADCLCLHEELELGVVISKNAQKIPKEKAYDYIAGYTIALDMTARDIQDELKKAGHPWFLAKSFDTSCPIGDFIDKTRITDPHDLEIYCSGDLILTGTPSGVSQCVSGDRITIGISGITEASFVME